MEQPMEQLYNEEVEEGEEEEEEDDKDDYLDALLDGKKVKLCLISMVYAKMANGCCAHCQAPFVIMGQQKPIIKIFKCNLNKTVMWICQEHINELEIAPEDRERDEERWRQEQQYDDKLGPNFVEIASEEGEECFRVWPRANCKARFPSMCSLSSCNEIFQKGRTRIMGAKRFEPDLERFARKLDVFGRETRRLYWICASHFSEHEGTS
jgi:hypothetical protein